MAYMKIKKKSFDCLTNPGDDKCQEILSQVAAFHERINQAMEADKPRSRNMNENDYDFGLNKKIHEYPTEDLQKAYKKMHSIFKTIPGAKEKYPMAYKKLIKIKKEISSRQQ